MKFWDSSALFPLLIEEPKSSSMRRLLHLDDDVVAWWGTSLECYSALARLKRDHRIKEGELVRARGLLDEMADAWNEIYPAEDLHNAAERALFLHSLKAADALQLAAALGWARYQPLHHEFVCLDQRLRDAARAEGFHVIPESL